MKNQMKFIGLIVILLAFFNTAQGQTEKPNVETWPETAKKAANAMMEKYGEPDEQTESMLIWNNTEPFIKTIVYKEEIQHDFSYAS